MIINCFYFKVAFLIALLLLICFCFFIVIGFAEEADEIRRDMRRRGSERRDREGDGKRQ